MIYPQFCAVLCLARFNSHW